MCCFCVVLPVIWLLIFRWRRSGAKLLDGNISTDLRALMRKEVQGIHLEQSKYPFVALNFDENRSDSKHVYEKEVVLKSLSVAVFPSKDSN